MSAVALAARPLTAGGGRVSAFVPARRVRPVAPIREVRVDAYCIPPSAPRAGEALVAGEVTLVVVEVRAGTASGLGYTYADVATARLLQRVLGPALWGLDATDIAAAWSAMDGVARSAGLSSAAALAVSAVDVALWDLKARLLDVPLVSLLRPARSAVAVYASGGFAPDAEDLSAQLQSWAELGIPRFKLKVGADVEADRRRVARARRALGRDAALFVDADGGYTRGEALEQAEAFADANVTWFEEPISANDLEGLRLVQERAPAGMSIAAGEDGCSVGYFRRMLEAGAIDVLQVDASRCGGMTGFLAAAALCDACEIPLSAHRAPALHLHVACAAPALMHLEYFHDHVRVEEMFFEGVVRPRDGVLAPDLTRPGMGLTLKRAAAAKFAVGF